jgi:beta-lactamase regulating signal transducer with metallopeptidase domain
MEAAFMKLVNMSITASWLIIAVIMLRFFLMKAPKYIRCILWGLVGVRLVFPVSFESFLSLIPNAEIVNPEIIYSKTPVLHSGMNIFNQLVNPVISESLSPTADAFVNPIQVINIASIVWIIGIAVLALYGIISYLRLRNRTSMAVLIGNNIWQSETVQSPFVLGLFRPRIYLPFGMNEECTEYVIAHENAHIKRFDHWIKPFGFLLLAAYWFNPLIWLAYIFLCRDIELACDERVAKALGAAGKKAYSEALLNCSIPYRMIAACPLAFGEVGVKQRIKNVLNYQKPALWIIIVAVISCVGVAACFLTNPKDDKLSSSDIETLNKYDNKLKDNDLVLLLKKHGYLERFIQRLDSALSQKLEKELSEKIDQIVQWGLNPEYNVRNLEEIVQKYLDENNDGIEIGSSEFDLLVEKYLSNGASGIAYKAKIDPLIGPVYLYMCIYRNYYEGALADTRPKVFSEQYYDRSLEEICCADIIQDFGSTETLRILQLFSEEVGLNYNSRLATG